MAFGVTSTGFNRKRLDDVKTEIEDAQRTAFGDNVNLLPESVLGQLNGIFAEREALLWELAEAVFNSQYPQTAQDVPLDNVASITGTIRKDPSKSQIAGQLLFGTAGTFIGVGSIISVSGSPTSRFLTLADVTLVAGVDEIQKISYSADAASGSFDINIAGLTTTILAADDAATILTKLEATHGAGTFTVTGSQTAATGITITYILDTAAGFGKRNVAILTITANSILDGGASPVILTPSTITEGVPQGEANAEGETEGEFQANAGTLSVIETPIAGWAATANPLDAVIGQGVEDDAEFRIRRKEEVAKAGAATPDAVRADLLSVNDVTAVVVFFNNLDIIDLDGRPPHSVDIVIKDGDEDEIATAIFGTVGGGITFVGDISKVVKDSQNFDNTIKFSRPTPIAIHVEFDLSIDVDLFPVDGVAQVAAAILVYGNALDIGADVVVFGSDPILSCAVQDIPGITDLVIRVGIAVSPTLDDNIPIAAREQADFDSSRITVVTI